MQPATNSLAQSGDYVLDSYALLAYLKAEAGGESVKKLIEEAITGRHLLYLCVVNLGEVIYIMERERGLSDAQDSLAIITELPIEVVNADRNLTLAAAHLKADYPIAYADCFAAALAQQKNATLVTGDPEFNKLKPDSQVRIDWLKDS